MPPFDRIRKTYLCRERCGSTLLDPEARKSQIQSNRRFVNGSWNMHRSFTAGSTIGLTFGSMDGSATLTPIPNLMFPRGLTRNSMANPVKNTSSGCVIRPHISVVYVTLVTKIAGRWLSTHTAMRNTSLAFSIMATGMERQRRPLTPRRYISPTEREGRTNSIPGSCLLTFLIPNLKRLAEG